MATDRAYTRSGRSRGPRSAADLLGDAEEQREILTAEILSLQTRLSIAQRDQWQLQTLRQQYHVVVNEHHRCRNLRAQLEAQIAEANRLENFLLSEEEKTTKLEGRIDEYKERIRMMKRGLESRDDRTRYEEKLEEVEMLRTRLAESQEVARLAETRIASRSAAMAEKNAAIDERNRIIRYLKEFLESHGFRVHI